MMNHELNLISIIESVNAIIWEYDIAQDRWVYVSPQTQSILGFAPEEWVDLDFWVEHVHSDDRVWAKDYCLTATMQGKNHIFEYRFMKKNGGFVWLRDEVVVIMEHVKPIKLRGFMADITDLKEREEKIRYISFHDELTGLYNRRYFEEELKRIDNPTNYPITILFCDINELKKINDTKGHQQGDEVIKNIATLLSEHSRSNDIVTRWGGDEFAIIMPKTSSKDSENYINRIRSCMSNMKYYYGKIPFAIGRSTKTSINEDIMNVFRNAEIIMYEDKTNSIG